MANGPSWAHSPTGTDADAGGTGTGAHRSTLPSGSRPPHRARGGWSDPQRVPLSPPASVPDVGLTLNDEGARRSTQTRTRPLEYWRGERKSYGREHNSLITVKSIQLRTPEPQWPLPSGMAEKAKRKARTKLAAEAAGAAAAAEGD